MPDNQAGIGASFLSMPVRPRLMWLLYHTRLAFQRIRMFLRAAVMGAGVAVAAMMAGCATGTSEKEIRARPPMRMFTPAKMADVAKCLRNNLGDEATVVNLPAQNQTEIRIGQPKGSGEFAYAYLISLTARPDGTAVELRKTDTWFPQMTPQELETETKACARG
ncbi:hypothetical protein [Cupriavidus consociatus]|uniref:hypothetical protein n=1 Tax=Cupriavidus consociatus TaxID=2821357 RepID=UPI001FD80973|nr:MULTISPECIES: hypothetical protein [unclassified Cupriavidus]MDK2655213.1 hypothetical protein [Cupriavidus sp. LEh21]